MMLGRRAIVFLGCGLVLGAAQDARAQVVSQRSVSLTMAAAMANAARAACSAAGYDVSVAVVDRDGELKLLFKADSANPHNAEVARRKAYTARTFHITSLEFQKRTLPDSPLAAQRNIGEVIAMGGGAPVTVGTGAGAETIGGIGVSGSPSQEQDEACASAGLAAVATALR